MEIRAILVPTDFSECASRAVPCAASMARLTNARILCLHVIEPVMPAAVGYAPMAEPLPLTDIGEQLGEEARAKLPRLASCEEFYGLEVSELTARGEAATEIVRVAAENEIDLIVIASHGRTGIERMLFGSIAETVVRTAPCAVMVVKGK